MGLLENGINEKAVTQAYRSEVGAEWIVAVDGIELSLAMQNGDVSCGRSWVGKRTNECCGADTLAPLSFLEADRNFLSPHHNIIPNVQHVALNTMDRIES